jgi:hypothetical protein
LLFCQNIPNETQICRKPNATIKTNRLTETYLRIELSFGSSSLHSILMETRYPSKFSAQFLTRDALGKKKTAPVRQRDIKLTVPPQSF